MCYERTLKRNPDARGRLLVRFTVDRCGMVSDAALGVERGDVRDTAACVGAVVRRWRTPFRPSGPVEIEYPISLAPGVAP
jgi:hypothetical protein